ncbi:MAG: Rv1355c family protein [Thiolinea sp.]
MNKLKLNFKSDPADVFPGFREHHFQPFTQGHIDIKLPLPNSDIRLFIFKPVQYPYLWIKYLEGLKREYTRMGVEHILDIERLSNPVSTSLAMLAIIDGEVLAGIRFHGPLKRSAPATVLKEMAAGNPELLKECIDGWLPENVNEPKGLWINTQTSARKRLLQLMARCVIYGSLILDCRYAICTSPKNITRMHKDLGIEVIEEIGCVPYPNNQYETTFGYFDMHQILEKCNDQNRVLLKRDWQQIHYARMVGNDTTPVNEWRPVILDTGNPFHNQAVESLLIDSDYEKLENIAVMQEEFNEILPPVTQELKDESNRWVLYPWRKVAIELLGPNAFRKLLHDRNRNKITDEEQKILSGLKIGVVGLSTGHVIAHTLAMEGICGVLKLADFDVLEVSNLNRIPANLLDINVNKAVATARRIAELDPYLEIEVFEDGVTEANIHNFMDGLDIVIEECDSLDIKVMVREVAQEYKIPVVMATSDLGMLDIERFDLDENLAPFHGLVDVSTQELKGLSRRDKAGYALGILEGEKISGRLAASMAEIDHSVKTWPQLASDVTQGAAMVAAAVRTIGLDHPLPSGRTRMDMIETLNAIAPPQSPATVHTPTPSVPEFNGQLKPDMLLAACYAPSPGNIQPWNITWQKNKLHIELRRDLTTSMDVKWRGALISLGAACLNAEIIAAKHNMFKETCYFPEPDNPDLAITVTTGRNAAGNKSKAPPIELLNYVLSRSTNRNLGEPRKIPAATMAKLETITGLYPVKMHTLSTREDIEQYIMLAEESDRLRHLADHLHNEMMQELIWPQGKPIEQGIDVRSLELPEKDLNVLPIIQRKDVMENLAEWNVGKALGEYNRKRIDSSSAVVMLSIPGGTERDYMLGGKALQHFWLLAEKHGLAVHPVSPVFLYAQTEEEVETLMQGNYTTEVSKIRSAFNKLLNLGEDDHPVLVMRLGYAKKPTCRSYRRALDNQ